MRKLIILILLLFSFNIVLANDTKEVTFNIEGELLTFDVEFGKPIGSIKTPFKEEYKFIGWFYNGKLYDFATPVTNDIELTAIFIEKDSNIYVKKNSYKYFILGLHIVVLSSFSLPVLYYIKNKYRGGESWEI